MLAHGSVQNQVFACKTRCKSQFCRDCALSHCVMWRERLRPAIKHWESVLMLTLTVDPKTVDGPKDALELVQRRRAISKTIAKLKQRKILSSTEYTVTLEFHESGYPHWHVLVNASFVCKHKLQREWGLGIVWISKGDFDDINHAINYATKYIVKTNSDEDKDEFLFPEWVMDMKTNLRRFSASRAISKKWARKHKPRIAEVDREPRERITKTGRQKIEQCGKTATVLIRSEKAEIVRLPCGTQTVEHHETYTFVGHLEIEWHPGMAQLKQFEIEELLRRQAKKSKEPMIPKVIKPNLARGQSFVIYRKLKSDQA